MKDHFLARVEIKQKYLADGQFIKNSNLYDLQMQEQFFTLSKEDLSFSFSAFNRMSYFSSTIPHLIFKCTMMSERAQAR